MPAKKGKKVMVGRGFLSSIWKGIKTVGKAVAPLIKKSGIVSTGLSAINQNLFISSDAFIIPTNPDPFSIMAFNTHSISPFNPSGQDNRKRR